MSPSRSTRKIRIGTRATNLAMRQAEILAGAIINKNLAKEENIEIIKIKSSGDIITSSIGPYDGKSLFTKEIDQALIEDRIDIAAHSVKDIESFLPEGIDLLGVLKRMDPRDALITNENIKSIDELPNNCLVGTASPRRGAILKSLRQDLNIIEFRGNFETRIKKLQNKEVDATLLAMAGIQRLNFAESNILPFETDVMIPAAGQGAIGMVARTNDKEIMEIISDLNHIESFTCIVAERMVLQNFGGSCFQPIAAFANFDDDGKITINSMISNDAGTLNHNVKEYAQRDTVMDIAGDIGRRLLEYYHKSLKRTVNS